MVYNENAKVLSTYSKFITTTKIPKEQFVAADCDKALNDMIIEMGKELGYSQINNNWIEEHFYPKSSMFAFYSQYYSHLNHLKSMQMYLDEPPTDIGGKQNVDTQPEAKA